MASYPFPSLLANSPPSSDDESIRSVVIAWQGRPSTSNRTVTARDGKRRRQQRVVHSPSPKIENTSRPGIPPTLAADGTIDGIPPLGKVYKFAYVDVPPRLKGPEWDNVQYIKGPLRTPKEMESTGPLSIPVNRWHVSPTPDLSDDSSSLSEYFTPKLSVDLGDIDPPSNTMDRTNVAPPPEIPIGPLPANEQGNLRRASPVNRIRASAISRPLVNRDPSPKAEVTDPTSVIIDRIHISATPDPINLFNFSTAPESSIDQIAPHAHGSIGPPSNSSKRKRVSVTPKRSADAVETDHHNDEDGRYHKRPKNTADQRMTIVRAFPDPQFVVDYVGFGFPSMSERGSYVKQKSGSSSKPSPVSKSVKAKGGAASRPSLAGQPACHQCRRKRDVEQMSCRRCPFRFCKSCIGIRYDFKFDVKSTTFDCPRCLKYCNCSICLRKRGLGHVLDEFMGEGGRSTGLSAVTRKSETVQGYLRRKGYIVDGGQTNSDMAHASSSTLVSASTSSSRQLTQPTCCAYHMRPEYTRYTKFKKSRPIPYVDIPPRPRPARRPVEARPSSSFAAHRSTSPARASSLSPSLGTDGHPISESDSSTAMVEHLLNPGSSSSSPTGSASASASYSDGPVLVPTSPYRPTKLSLAPDLYHDHDDRMSRTYLDSSSMSTLNHNPYSNAYQVGEGMAYSYPLSTTLYNPGPLEYSLSAHFLDNPTPAGPEYASLINAVNWDGPTDFEYHNSNHDQDDVTARAIAAAYTAMT